MHPLSAWPRLALTLGVGTVVLAAVAYGELFPDRTDCVGHFLAGAGGTFLLLAIVVAAAPERRWPVVIAVWAAILLGVFTEATVFRLAEFDPVDLATRAWAPSWPESGCWMPDRTIAPRRWLLLPAWASWLRGSSMRSRERGFAWAAATVALTGVLFAALATWALVARSTIPIELDGTVTAVELRHEKHPGVDDVWLVSIDNGDLRHVDSDVAALLVEGERVQKDAWDSTLVVDGNPHQVALSADARAMLVLAPALAVVIAALTLFTSLRAQAHRRTTT